ncbi:MULTISPECIES: hypothetical protein [Streptomyces]|uniref:Uncharacterized protein n=2 Tax=Streptomyces TaxID=1883 RepID=A0A100Y5W9_9ACTN|nr:MULTISPECIES: hypothetical protein [Streptomyces]KUH38292.1 hypothetical protein ATE80_13300 [Streptomyces kanasensis]UUS32141.1 hypothetical protein NRO40_15815 [Streptomyces changanensis]
METAIAAAVIIILIGMGMLLLHRLTVRHEERIAAFHYSDTLPGIGRHRGRNDRGVRNRGQDQDGDRDGDGDRRDTGPAGRPTPPEGGREPGAGGRA